GKNIFNKIIVLLVFCFTIQTVYAQDILLNEIVSNSDGFYPDEDEDASDWVEIYNPSAQPVQLSGFFLTDDSEYLDKWMFPDVILNPFEYMVVFCSGKNRSSEPFHTNFKLKSSGEPL